MHNVLHNYYIIAHATTKSAQLGIKLIDIHLSWIFHNAITSPYLSLGAECMHITHWLQ